MRVLSVVFVAVAALGTYAQDPSASVPVPSDTLAPAPTDTTLSGSDTALPPVASDPAGTGSAPLPGASDPAGGAGTLSLPGTGGGTGGPIPPVDSTIDNSPLPTETLPGDGGDGALGLGASPVALSLLVAGVVGAML